MEGFTFNKTLKSLENLKDVFRCKLCSELKSPDAILCTTSCAHFFCNVCLVEGAACPIDCQKETQKLSVNPGLYAIYKGVLLMNLEKLKNMGKVIPEPVLKIQNKAEKPKPKETGSRKIGGNLKPKTEKLGIDLKTEVKKKAESPSRNTRRRSLLSKSSPIKEEKCDVKTADFLDQKPEKKQNKKKVETKTDKIKKGKQTATEEKQTLQMVTDNVDRDVHISGNETSISINPRSKLNLTKRVNRRNPKGETPLHLACKKCDLIAVEELIVNGADPNAKDNAGWTPLHDCIIKGNLKIIELLLKKGAKVNMPGLENMTPLHQSILEQSMDVTKLLLSYGASVNTRNIFGQTPVDLAEFNGNEKIQKLLKEEQARFTEPDDKLDTSLNQTITEDVVIFPSGLSKEELKKLKELQSECLFDISNSFTSKHSVTHVVIPIQDIFVPDINILTAIIYGCWIVGYNWIEECRSQHKLLTPDLYDIGGKHPELKGLSTGRLNRISRLPGLFSGCHFFLGGCFEHYEISNKKYPRSVIRNIIEKSDGKMLKRCPNPESINLEQTVPFHTDPDGPLASCCYYIIFQHGKWDPALKYNMRHVKTLPIDWLIASILNYKLIDPAQL